MVAGSMIICSIDMNQIWISCTYLSFPYFRRSKKTLPSVTSAAETATGVLTLALILALPAAEITRMAMRKPAAAAAANEAAKLVQVYVLACCWRTD
jgi:hypothetical protein